MKSPHIILTLIYSSNTLSFIKKSTVPFQRTYKNLRNFIKNIRQDQKSRKDGKKYLEGYKKRPEVMERLIQYRREYRKRKKDE